MSFGMITIKWNMKKKQNLFDQEQKFIVAQ